MSMILFGFSSNGEKSIQPRIACGYCNKDCKLACLQNRTYKYTTPCTWSASCSVRVYMSEAASICNQCARFVEYYGAHECLERHSTCHRGDKDICTIGFTFPGTFP